MFGNTFDAELINNSGKVVLKGRNLNAGINKLTVANVLHGIYILKISNGSQNWFKKVIVK